MKYYSQLVLVSAILLEVYLVDGYTVAVMEFAINRNISASSAQVLEENTRNFINMIEQAKSNVQDLDLVVFPESTLTPYFNAIGNAAYLPPVDNVALCNSTNDIYPDFLRNLSCAAIRYNTTVVINLTEKDQCNPAEDDCSESGLIYYNTNLVFGPGGNPIARYRKWNLFGEINKSKPKVLDLPVLQIANTTFGIMTCFDIQFGVPAFNLTREQTVANVIFPLNWISELPYLTALQIEQMWAQEMNVVLLASGASLPQAGAGGSGIFLGSHGAVAYEILPESGTKLLIHEVPTNQTDFNVPPQDIDTDTIDSLGRSMDGFFMLVDPSLKEHNSLVLNTTVNSTLEATVCHGDPDNTLCCNFNVGFTVNGSLSGSNAYVYHLVVFNGVRTYSGVYYGGVETCGVVACLNESVTSCGQRFQNYSTISWPVTFTAINVTGNFTRSESRFQLPTTLLSSIRPLQVSQYSWRKLENSSETLWRSVELLEPQNRLLTFGIFGRDFERDWDPLRNSTNGGVTPTTPSASFKTTIILLVCYHFLLLVLKDE